MKLSRLLEALGRRVTEPAHGTGESDIRGLCYDSRRAEKGDLFIALKGLKASGSDFAADAIGRGAVAVVSDAPAQGPVTVPWVVVEDAREAMAVLSDEFYEHPSTVMSVVGITGTNGKTTTAYLLRALFEAAGMKSGLLTPESSDSGQNGTVIAPVSSRWSRPRSRPLSPLSISNCHSPLRHSQSGRANCGRGYSGRGMDMVGSFNMCAIALHQQCWLAHQHTGRIEMRIP